MNAEAAGRDAYVVPRLQKLSREAFTPRMVGFMLSKAWVYILFLAPTNFYVNEPEGIPFGFAALSRDALILTLLLGGLILGSPRMSNRKPLHSAIALGIPAAGPSLGCLTLALATLLPNAANMLLPIASVLTGLGSGSLALLWGLAYGKEGGPTSAAEASLAFCFAALIVPFYAIAPNWLQLGISLVLPPASTLLFARTVSKPVLTSTAGDGTLSDRPAKRFLAKIAVNSIVFGFVIVLMRQLYEQQAVHAPLSSALLFSAASFVAAAIVLALLITTKQLDLAFSYRPVLILLGLGCFLLPFLENGSTLPYLFARIGYVCFLILNWVMLSDLAFRSSLPTALIFGVGQASSSFGMLVGSSFSNMMHAIGAGADGQAQALSGMLVFILLITQLLTAPNATIRMLNDESAQTTSEKRRTPSFRERCASISEQYHLGERASEVMVLFAKGRSKARIEQELYISQSTVSFHLRNIYQKLGVHSRQELMDFIENFETSDDSYD